MDLALGLFSKSYDFFHLMTQRHMVWTASGGLPVLLWDPVKLIIYCKIYGLSSIQWSPELHRDPGKLIIYCKIHGLSSIQRSPGAPPRPGNVIIKFTLSMDFLIEIWRRLQRNWRKKKKSPANNIRLYCLYLKNGPSKAPIRYTSVIPWGHLRGATWATNHLVILSAQLNWNTSAT